MADPTNPGPREIRVGWTPTSDATVLAIRRTGAPPRRWFGGSWAVTDAQRTLATAHMPLTSHEMPIHANGRHLTFRMPSRRRFRSPAEFTVIDDTNGEHIVAATRLTGGREHNLVCEQWQLAVTGHPTIAYVYRVAEPRTFGYYDHNGTPLLQVGHDPTFTAHTGDSWARILLRLWGGALASGDRYLVAVHDQSINTPLLALIAVWMERTADSRYPSSAGA